MTIEELRPLNPGHWVIPTDEEIAEVTARHETEARELAEAAEREKQSIRDQVASLSARLSELEAQG